MHYKRVMLFSATGSAPWYSKIWSGKSHVNDVWELKSGQANVVIDDEITNMNSMFNGCSNLTSLDLFTHFNTSKVTNMRNMFCNCYNLTELDLSAFNTSKVTSMNSMFYNCPGLTSIDLSSFNTSNVTSMEHMFYGCNGLTTLDLSNFDTSNVTDMHGMFINCSNLTTIKGVIDMKSCEDWYDMFLNCPKLKGVKIKNPPDGFESVSELSKSQYTIVDNEADSCKKGSKCSIQKIAFIATGSAPWFSNLWVDGSHVIDVAELLSQAIVTFDDKVTNMEHMFYHCNGLTSLDLFSYFDTSKVTNMCSMFNSCFNLTALDLSGFNTSKVTNMSFMFFNCHGLTSLDLSSFNTSNVDDMECMFGDCTSLTALDLSNFDTSKVKNMSYMFKNCYNLTTIKGVIDMKSCKWCTDMFKNCPKLKGVKIKNPPTEFNEHWVGLSKSQYTIVDDESNSLKSKNIMKTQVFVSKGNSPWFNPIWWTDKEHVINTDKSTFNQATVTCDGNVTNMRSMFNACDNLTTIDLSNFDASNVTDMAGLFNECSNLATLDLSNLNTFNVKDMGLMFESCRNLTTLDLSSFNTSNVEYMNDMFSDCYKLTTLDLSGFNTSKVINMSYMFYNCPNLTTLDLSSFDTSKVDNMRYMFEACSSLTTLDISKFNTSKVDDMGWMFTDCISLTTIKGVIDMKSCKHYKGMFVGCPRLTNVKIKNPPSDFESETGISSFQYTIVDDESDSLKRRNNMFKTTGIEPIDGIDVPINIYRVPDHPEETIICTNYIPSNANNDAPKYDKATQEVDDKKEEAKNETMSNFNKAVKDLSNKLDEIVNKNNTEESSPKKEEVSKETKAEDHKPTNEEKIYNVLKNFIYESDFIPAFLWFMEHAYNNVSFAHQHKRRVYKIYKEIIKGGNLFGKCIGDISDEQGNCAFFMNGSDRALKDFRYNRQAKAAKLLAKFIIASNTTPYVLDLISYYEDSDMDCYTAIPTAISDIRMVYKSELYVKTLEKVCFGRDF